MKALTVLSLVFAVLVSSLFAEDDRVFEMRTYYANEGKLDALNARFRDHTVALFEKHGMTNIGYFVPVENMENALIYFLAYPSRDARKAAWKAFHSDPDWKAAYAESTKDGKLIAKVVSQFMQPTDYSPELKIASEDPERLFELRIYTTNEGKLPNINARFRDHTIDLFAKHGMNNLIYFNLMEDQEGAANTLVYLLSHKDAEARDASFAGFREDEAWKTARAASEEAGPILVKGGVKSVLMKPTDYSPMK